MKATKEFYGIELARNLPSACLDWSVRIVASPRKRWQDHRRLRCREAPGVKGRNIDARFAVSGLRRGQPFLRSGGFDHTAPTGALEERFPVCNGKRQKATGDRRQNLQLHSEPDLRPGGGARFAPCLLSRRESEGPDVASDGRRSDHAAAVLPDA